MTIDTNKMRKAIQDGGPMRNVWMNGSTHYEGCEYQHFGCAVLALCNELDEWRRGAELVDVAEEIEALGNAIKSLQNKLGIEVEDD